MTNSEKEKKGEKKKMEKFYLFVDEVGEMTISERKPNKNDLQLAENGELSLFVIKGNDISIGAYDSNYPIQEHTFYNEDGEIEESEEDVLDRDREELELDKDDNAEDTKEDDEEVKPIDEIINGTVENNDNDDDENNNNNNEL